MYIWKYKIIGNSGSIYTSNTLFAEEKSKLGKLVFCKRETNIRKFK